MFDPHQELRYFFLLLSTCMEILYSAPKRTKFLPQSKRAYEKCEQESKSIPYPEWKYIHDQRL